MERNRRTLLAATLALFLAFAVKATRADTYTVTNTSVSGPGSLAQAILDSNARTGQDTIVFQIPGSGVHLIDLSQSALPEITDSVILDGYTQPGAHPNTLSIGDDAVILVQLDGGLVKGRRGLVISGSNCLVQGLSITGFQYDSSSDPYFFRVLNGFGIQLLSKGTGNVIQGNFIGVNPDGLTPRANYVGVRVEGPQSIIGSNDPAARNIISGNSYGFQVHYPATLIAGNYVGTDGSGMRAVGNSTGIAVAAADVVIGGTAAGAGNLISGNAGGIQLGYEVAYHLLGHADRGLVEGNLIGTAADGVTPLGNTNTGVSVAISSNSTVGGTNAAAGNVIAFNGSYGVLVNGTGNRVLSNSIYSNIGRGIFLYSQYANNGQSAPVITSQITSRARITAVSGTLQSTPNTEFLLQFFTDSQSLVTSKQTYVTSRNVTTDDNGAATFSASFGVSEAAPVINATATDPNGNTSEFSRHPINLQNLSARAAVGTGDNALIGGLQAQYGQIVVRGIGPSLTPLGVPNALADPTLEFQNQFGTKMFDDNWKDDQSQASTIQKVGLAPTNDAESAIAPFVAYVTPFGFSPGFSPYTAVLRGKGDTTGTGVVEIYATTDSTYGALPKIGNLSARGFVGTDDNVLIGGFILGDGSENTRIVVRAIGPSLKAAGVNNALADPMLELHDGNGELISSNDNWSDSQKDDLKTVGFAPSDDAESAILIRRPAGAYTAIVRGKDNGTGVALVEVYNLP